MGKLIIILAFALVGAAQAYPKIINKSSLVGHWSFDAVSGSTVEDSSGNGATGTAAGGGAQVSGKIGSGWSFDGVDDTIPCTHKSNQLLTSGGTIIAWIKPNSVGEGSGGRIVDKSTTNTAGAGYSYKTNFGSIVTLTVAGGTEVSSGTIRLGVWSHCAATFDSSGLVTHYINGKVSGTPAASGAASGISTTNALTIGNRSTATTRTFNGVIDEVWIYNRVLNPTEIYQHYRSGVANHGQ